MTQIYPPRKKRNNIFTELINKNSKLTPHQQKQNSSATKKRKDIMVSGQFFRQKTTLGKMFF